MSEPRRWLDDPDGAPDGVRALLESASPTEGPDDTALARVAARAAARASAGTLVTSAAWWKLGLATVGLAVGVGVLVARREDHAPSRPPAPVVAARSAPAAPSPPAPPAPVTAPHTSTTAPSPRPRAALHPASAVVAHGVVAPRAVVSPTVTAPAVTPPATPHTALGGVPSGGAATSSDALHEELAWLREAQRALDADPASALSGLRAYPTRFPHGQLAAEARWLTFEALRRSGAMTEARSLGAAMLRDDPRGPYARRVQRALDEATATP